MPAPASSQNVAAAAAAAVAAAAAAAGDAELSTTTVSRLIGKTSRFRESPDETCAPETIDLATDTPCIIAVCPTPSASDLFASNDTTHNTHQCSLPAGTYTMKHTVLR